MTNQILTNNPNIGIIIIYLTGNKPITSGNTYIIDWYKLEILTYTDHQ